MIPASFTFWQWIGILVLIFIGVIFIPAIRDRHLGFARFRAKEAVNHITVLGWILFIFWLITFWILMLPAVIGWTAHWKIGLEPTTQQALNGIPYGFLVALWVIILTIIRWAIPHSQLKFTESETAIRQEEHKKFMERVCKIFRVKRKG